MKTRSGTTLTEVLIAILIMSFGIATVATLFPIAAMRSANAVKLTNATILRYNAEAISELYPQLIHDPDGDGNLNEHAGSRYIIDPIGWYAIGSTLQGKFGNYGGTPEGPTRFAVATQAQAKSLFMLQDSWSVLNEGTAVSSPAPTTNAAGQVIGVTLSDDTDLSDVTDILLASPVRVNVFSLDGKNVHSRMLPATGTPVSGTAIVWDAAEPLPKYMSAAQIGRVQLEVQEFRYSWLLTVRKRVAPPIGGNAEVDVVVFFKRDLAEADETLYQAAFAKNQMDATITYNSSIEVPFKKGHWVFDANNCHWYRVQDISDPPTVSGSNASVTITLDRPAVDASPAGGTGRAMFPRGVVDVYPIGTKTP